MPSATTRTTSPGLKLSPAQRPGICVRPPPATFRHPMVGTVTVHCDALDLADRDQRVVICTAAPGSPSEEALRLLSVIGTERMDVPG
jgi:hypothetical protein